ncbi:hypothetical protein RF11_01570 [Thelohanellus kitauei]|uniref:ISXO2-like transposase domain-containing protein n=1 Tax=Thelohanellus kitauei TaxID=669202 RepID=A0A0C2JF66_THEKT|nr:hypothetical protein RF11_01570 [Thelohanellus kitauei]
MVFVVSAVLWVDFDADSPEDRKAATGLLYQARPLAQLQAHQGLVHASTASEFMCQGRRYRCRELDQLLGIEKPELISLSRLTKRAYLGCGPAVHEPRCSSGRRKCSSSYAPVQLYVVRNVINDSKSTKQGEIIKDENTAIKYLISEGMISPSEFCPFCSGENITLRRKNWSCCKKKLPKIRVTIQEALLRQNQTEIEGILNFFMTYYAKHFRRLLITSLDFVYMQTGRPGVIVEIYEFGLGNNKLHRRHPSHGLPIPAVSEAWVIGGVELTRKRRLFLFEVSDRTANTFMPVITAHVIEGSPIITDFQGL